MLIVDAKHTATPSSHARLCCWTVFAGVPVRTAKNIVWTLESSRIQVSIATIYPRLLLVGFGCALQMSAQHGNSNQFSA